jgi:hypothetical protein
LIFGRRPIVSNCGRQNSYCDTPLSTVINAAAYFELPNPSTKCFDSISVALEEDEEDPFSCGAFILLPRHHLTLLSQTSRTVALKQIQSKPGVLLKLQQEIISLPCWVHKAARAKHGPGTVKGERIQSPLFFNEASSKNSGVVCRAVYFDGP